MYLLQHNTISFEFGHQSSNIFLGYLDAYKTWMTFLDANKTWMTTYNGCRGGFPIIPLCESDIMCAWYNAHMLIHLHELRIEFGESKII